MKLEKSGQYFLSISLFCTSSMVKQFARCLCVSEKETTGTLSCEAEHFHLANQQAGRAIKANPFR